MIKLFVIYILMIVPITCSTQDILTKISSSIHNVESISKSGFAEIKTITDHNKNEIIQSISSANWGNLLQVKQDMTSINTIGFDRIIRTLAEATWGNLQQIKNDIINSGILMDINNMTSIITMGLKEVADTANHWVSAVNGDCVVSYKWSELRQLINMNVPKNLICLGQLIESTFMIKLLQDKYPSFKEIYDDNKIQNLKFTSEVFTTISNILLQVNSALDSSSTIKIQMGLCGVSVVSSIISFGLKTKAHELESKNVYILSKYKLNGISMYQISGDFTSSAMPIKPFKLLLFHSLRMTEMRFDSVFPGNSSFMTTDDYVVKINENFEILQ